LTARNLDVFVGVASIPSRESWLRMVVERLLPQARKIGVYLNGYDETPAFLDHRRIVVARSQDYGDLRDNGKFFFLNQSESRYYATIDDDILYPTDYLKRLAGFLGSAGRLAAVGVHGAIYPYPIIDMFRSRYLLHFEDPLSHVIPVHFLGTGTTMIDQVEWDLQFAEFGEPGMADVWFAAAASKRKASQFVVRRRRRWLEKVERATRDSGGALFYEGLLDDRTQVAVLEQAGLSTGGFEGLVNNLLASSKFAEEFSLLQAVHLDEIRRQVGYAPLDDSVGVVIESQRTHWPDAHGLTATEWNALQRLMIAVLADQVSADNVMPVVELIDRLRDMSVSDPQRLQTLPLALRFAARKNHAERVRVALVDRALRRSAGEAARLWGTFKTRDEIPLSLALDAEGASVHTQFERLPAFIDRARKDPPLAASQLYESFEVNGWRRAPDIAGLRQAFGHAFDSLEVQMLICMASARSGNLDFAKRTLINLQRRWPWDVDVGLMAASLEGLNASTPRGAILPVLDLLDQALGSNGIATYRDLLRTEESGHWIHLFSARARHRPDSSTLTPAVSVVLTTYNDEATIEASIRSILASKGVDLQLVVVDDASTDDTLKVIESIDDPRVTVVHNDVNLGPYGSRNRGLENVTGQYVAIADADDWSHPERLAYQVSLLEASPHVYACKTAHVRIQPSGHIDLENNLRFVGDGPMTLMFRRWLLDHIGGFDHIRTRGDIEFLRRLAARFGPEALVSSGMPLVLSTSTRNSNSKRFREASVNVYRQGARQWHEQKALSDALYVPLRESRAPFIAPHDLTVQPSEARRS
jgi:hypothetical protein